MRPVRILLAALLLTIGFSSVISVYADGTWRVPLVAGQHTTVGNVTVTQVGQTVTVSFQITDFGWCLETTHLYVDDQPPSHIAPGRFTYKHENLGCVATDTYSVTANSAEPWIAAHAEVVGATYTPVLNTGSSSGNIVVHGSGDSYFDTNYTDSTGTYASGTYDGWCVDLDHYITTNTNYGTSTYSSYGSLPGGIVDHPENLDLINYIINQNYIAQGMSAYDIQRAIWMLIDNKPPPGGGSLANAQAIVADAQANGEGFVPGCGQVMAVILAPTSGTNQITIIEYPVPCVPTAGGGGETAWALAPNGTPFGQGWGSYFQLVATSPALLKAESGTASGDVRATSPESNGDGATTGGDSSSAPPPPPPPPTPAVASYVAAQPAQPDGSIIHTVRDGDTLASIVYAYRDYGLTRERLLEINREYNGWSYEPQYIYPGDTIMILPPGSVDPATGEMINDPFAAD